MAKFKKRTTINPIIERYMELHSSFEIFEIVDENHVIGKAICNNMEVSLWNEMPEYEMYVLMYDEDRYKDQAITVNVDYFFDSPYCKLDDELACLLKLKYC